MASEHYHLIGIGGIGMSALARILLKQNATVTGSDQSHNSVIEKLSLDGAVIHIGHCGEKIHPGATVVYSSAIRQDNPEFQTAKELCCKLLHRSELLAQLSRGYETLAVTGSHGKTTTSSLLTTVLKKANLDPAFALGGILLEHQSNGDGGTGAHFVLEADESDGSFLNYDVSGAIVTNIDNDHLDHYGSVDGLKKAMEKFIAKVRNPNLLFWCGDDQVLSQLAMHGCSYGFGVNCQWRALNYRQAGWKTVFDVEYNGRCYPAVEVALTGPHHALNALAVFGLALKLGVPEEIIREALSTFSGVARRCEKKGESNEVLILDDYAHHPTEVAATLKAVKKAVGERRLIAVFQPHRFSRTQDCLDAYSKAFDEADLLVMTDIYPGPGEKPIEGLTSHAILQKIAKHSSVPFRYVPRSALGDELLREMLPHDIVLMMSAGDLPKLGDELAKKITKTPPKMTVGVVFGGRSAEHEISLESAQYIVRSLNPSLYDLRLFGITKSGIWIDSLDAIEKLKAIVDGREPEPEGPAFSPDVLDKLQTCDIFIPVLHGPFGEDGMVQGFFETLGKPYMGCDFRSAALCMDKALTKRIAESHGIRTSPYVDFSLASWKSNPDEIIDRIIKKLRFPIFVKSVHLGSSVGVTKVEAPDALPHAINTAFQFDIHTLAEEGIVGREMEFAVMGNEAISTPPPGEICTDGKIYDYEAKYGPDSMTAIPCADIPRDCAQIGQELAVKAYRAASCTGLARVDFFLDREGRYWLSEINPFPGFTRISMYPKVWEAQGWTPNQLIDRLLILGLQRKRIQDRHMKPLATSSCS